MKDALPRGRDVPSRAFSCVAGGVLRRIPSRISAKTLPCTYQILSQCSFVMGARNRQLSGHFAFVLVDEAHMGCATGAILNRSFIISCMAYSVLNNWPVSFSSPDNLMAPLWWFSDSSQL